MIFFLLLGLLLGAVSVIFALQNITPVTVSFFQWQLQGSLATILFLTLASGLLVAIFLVLPSLIKDQFLLSKEKRRNAELEKDLLEHKRLLVTKTTSEQETIL